MAADNIDAIGRFGLSAFQRRDYVREHRRLWHARDLRLFKCLLLDSHSSGRRDRGFLKFSVEPVTSSADTAIRIVLIRKCVARSIAHQLADCILNIARIDLSDDFRNLRVARSRRGLGRTARAHGRRPDLRR